MIKVIENKKDWDLWLSSIENFDFYHTYDYHNVFANANQKPILFVHEHENTSIGLPFFKRSLSNGYYDLASVHGYLGPIGKNVSQNFDNAVFYDELQNKLREEHIVTVFSKLNPFIPYQAIILKGLGSIETVGELVCFNQVESDEQQLKDYNRNTRQVLKKLKSNSSVVKGRKDDISDFIYLYHKSLDRLGAKELFYFDSKYFSALYDSSFFHTEILYTIDNKSEEIMAGGLIITTNDIAHIELAFTVEKFYKSSPLRLLFDYCRENYKGHGVRFLNLGGGSGGRDGSLMKFKASFSKNYVDFNVWKYIVMPDVYWEMLTKEQREVESGFFPKYRLKIA